MLFALREDVTRAIRARRLYDIARNCYNHYGVRTETAEMVDTVRERRAQMRCSIQGCPGEYEHRTIMHTVKRGDDVLVFEGVPAEVCDVCSDTLLAPETIRRIEELITDHAEPRKHAPVYSYS